MSMIPSSPSVSTVARNFWDRREGKNGKYIIYGITTIAIGIFIFYWGLILPFLIGVVGNTIQLAMLIGVLIVVTSPVWSTRVRFLISTMFQMTMRWITYSILSQDPIGVLRNNVVQLQKQAQSFDSAITSLAGSKQRLETDITNNLSQIQHNKALSDEVDKRLSVALHVTSTQESRLEIQRLNLQKEQYLQNAGLQIQTVNQEKPILDQTNKMYEQLVRIRELASFKVQSLGMQADMLEKRRKTILSSQKALGAANRILKGDPDQLDLVNQSVEYLNTEAADTLGAMEDFSRWSDKYLTDMDIQNGAAASEASKMFSQLEKKFTLPDSTGTQSIPLAPSLSTSDTADYSLLLK